MPKPGCSKDQINSAAPIIGAGGYRENGDGNNDEEEEDDDAVVVDANLKGMAQSVSHKVLGQSIGWVFGHLSFADFTLWDL